MRIKKLIGTLFGGFVTVLTPFATAQANSILVTYSGSAIFNGAPVGYETGWIAPNPNSEKNRANVYIGGDSSSTATDTDFSISGQFFNAWCVDIYHWLNSPVMYNVETEDDLAVDLDTLRGSGATRVNQLIQLADEVYSTLNSREDNAAFQLAVWEITYGTADKLGHYQIKTTDPGFNVDSGTESSAFAQKANNWLYNLDTAPNTGNYVLTYLDDGSRENTQDLVVFTALTTSNAQLNTVTEPRFLALLGLGLAGLGFTRRKPSSQELGKNFPS